MSWQALEIANPTLATFGKERLHDQVSYLATIRKDGAPRVHPVTPIIGDGHLFVFMEPTSPKGHDLRRDGRYALHCGVRDNSGESGEFIVTGHGYLVTDPALRSLASEHASYKPADRYILFELAVEQVQSTVYATGQPVRQQWRNA